MNLVYVKYNGNNNSESIPSTLFLHVVKCSSETNSTNKYPSKIFLGAKMQMWRLHRSLMIISIPSETEGLALVTTLIRFRCYIIVELYHICGNPEEIYRIITYFFIYWLCPCDHHIARPDVEDGETVCRHGE